MAQGLSCGPGCCPVHLSPLLSLTVSHHVTRGDLWSFLGSRSRVGEGPGTKHVGSDGSRDDLGHDSPSRPTRNGARRGVGAGEVMMPQ